MKLCLLIEAENISTRLRGNVALSIMSAIEPRSPIILRWDSTRSIVFGIVLLAVLLGAAYSNSFNVPFLFDDIDSIVENPTIRSLGTAFFPPAHSGITVSGRPVLNLSFAINEILGGTAVRGYHLLNLLLHVLAALALRALVSRTLRQPVLAGRYGSRADVIAWFAAALWALHPLLTVAVTYVAQRAEVLVALFYLLTLYGFIRSVQTPSRLWPWFTWLSCMAGMASKEVMVSAPLLVFLYDRTFVSGTFAESWRRHRRLHLSLAATWLLLAICIIQSGGRGGSVGYTRIAWWEYSFTQAYALVRYLWLTLWPADLVFDYGAVVILRLAVLIPCGVVIIGLLLSTVFALRRYPVAGFAGAWFFLILAPTSSIVPVVTQTVAEQRMYLPLAGIVAGIVLLLLRDAKVWRYILLGALILAAGLRTFFRNYDYRNKLALWTETAARFPMNPRASYNLGVIQLESGQVNSAISQFQASIGLAPRYALAHYNLGYALLKLQRQSEALAALETAVRLAPENNTFQATLADALLGMGRTEEALPHYQAALSSNPGDRELLSRYTSVVLKLGRYADSITLFQKSLRLDPSSPRLHANLGVSLIKSGRAEEGIREIQEAVKLAPGDDEIRYTLAAVLALNGHSREAIAEYEMLLGRGAPTADLLDMLGMLYSRTARYNEARAAFLRALTLEPDHAGARNNLANLEAFLSRQPSP